MTAYMRCVHQREIALVKSGVDICEDLSQDFGWESVDWLDHVDS